MGKNKHGGGANTNKNGLSFEQKTKLSSLLKSAGYKLEEVPNIINKRNKHQIYNVNQDGKHIGVTCSQQAFAKYLSHYHNVNMNDELSKNLQPDDVFVNDNTKVIYVIEKKFQNKEGSVDEKLQTCDFKKKQYKKLLKKTDYTVEYCYICSDWFNEPKYKDVHDYIADAKCHFFFNEIPLDYLGLGGCTNETR